MDTSEVRRVKEAQSYISYMRNKGKLSIFDNTIIATSRKNIEGIHGRYRKISAVMRQTR